MFKHFWISFIIRNEGGTGFRFVSQLTELGYHQITFTTFSFRTPSGHQLEVLLRILDKIFFDILGVLTLKV